MPSSELPARLACRWWACAACQTAPANWPARTTGTSCWATSTANSPRRWTFWQRITADLLGPVVLAGFKIAHESAADWRIQQGKEAVIPVQHGAQRDVAGCAVIERIGIRMAIHPPYSPTAVGVFVVLASHVRLFAIDVFDRHASIQHAIVDEAAFPVGLMPMEWRMCFRIVPFDIEDVPHTQRHLQADLQSRLPRLIVQCSCEIEPRLAGDFRPHALSTVLLRLPLILETKLHQIADRHLHPLLKQRDEEGIGRFGNSGIGVAQMEREAVRHRDRNSPASAALIRLLSAPATSARMPSLAMTGR